MSDWKDIGTLLMEFGLIDNNDLKEGLKVQRETGLRLGEALVKMGKVTMEDIEWVLSKQLDIPFVIVDDININMELLEQFEKEFLIENRVLPLYEADDRISIVIEDPFNKSAIALIESVRNKKVNLSTGNGSKIRELLKRTFKKIGLPELVDSIKDTIDRISETSFYRMDFLLAEHSCAINVYGSGILKNVTEIKTHFTNEDVFRALNDLNIPFLYEQSFGNNGRFLFVYPLLNKLQVPKFPAVLGMFGLFCPDSPTFSDGHVNGLDQVFPLEEPVPGYQYISLNTRASDYEKTLYLVDSAPAGFRDFYVNAYIPKKCPSCNGAGCGACGDLGYGFERLEGIYSSDDLMKKLNRE